MCTLMKFWSLPLDSLGSALLRKAETLALALKKPESASIRGRRKGSRRGARSVTDDSEIDETMTVHVNTTATSTILLCNKLL